MGWGSLWAFWAFGGMGREGSELMIMMGYEVAFCVVIFEWVWTFCGSITRL